MRTLTLSPVKSTAKSAEKHLHRLFRRAFLTRLLKRANFADLTPEEVAREYADTDEDAVVRLFEQIHRIGEKLFQKGKLDAERYQMLTRWQREANPVALGEKLSPYHAVLSEKEFYRLSDAPTRRLLRKDAARFATWHRLSPESTALIWKGERAHPPYFVAFLLPLTLPMAAIIGLLLARNLPLLYALPALLTLPALFGGFFLIAAAFLQKMLPSSPLPLLQSGEGHSILVAGIGSTEDSRTALEGMARIIAAGHSDCRYQLLLISPDGLLRENGGEAEEENAIRAEAEELANRFDCNLQVTFVKRRYDPAKKRWRGIPTFSELAALLWESISTADVSPNAPADSPPEAVCLLPVEATLLPGTFERLSAALFHPLCTADSLVFLPSSDSPLPRARLQTLRSCLLQKLNAPADFDGYGILKRDALQAIATAHPEHPLPLSPRLSRESFSCGGKYGGEKKRLLPAPLRQTPSLLEWLPTVLAIARPLLLLGMIAANLPPLLFLLLTLLSSADLLASALLSLSLSPKRFFLSTLPAWKMLAKELLSRLFLPLRKLSELHPLGGRVGFCLASLLFGGTAALMEALPWETPLFFLGVIWGIAPLLFPDRSTRPSLSSNQKAACHALAEEIYPLLLTERKLPPAYQTLSGESAPYTTPAAMGSQLTALLFACDLGLCDLSTLEKKIQAMLDQLEALPTKCGLPYARYSIETADYYKDSTIDSVECGIYALCLAALEGGLREYSRLHPSLNILAHRAARLADRMDFTLLLDAENRLCRTLSPTGEQLGHLSSLCGIGGISLFAALSSDSTLSVGSYSKKQTFSRLLAPISLKKGHCLILSEEGKLWEYLLPRLLLPIPDESLLSTANHNALRLCLGEARRIALRTARNKALLRLRHRGDQDIPQAVPALAPKSTSKDNATFCRLISWPHLSRSAPPPTTGSPLLGGKKAPEPLTAPLLCLLLEQKPRIALAELQRLQKVAPAGGFTDPAHGEWIPYTGLSFSLIALAGAVTSRSFRERVASLPRCGVLVPLLRTPTEHWQDSFSSVSESHPEKTSAPPSIFLLGDADHGLLLKHGGLLSLWEGGKPITVPSDPNALLTENRPTALLLANNGNLLPLPHRIMRRAPGQLLLEGEDMTCQILRETEGWSLTLTRAQAASVEFRFLLSPACRAGTPLRLTTLKEQASISNADSVQSADNVETQDSSIGLIAELSPSLALAAELRGVCSPFTHADPSPFPRGIGQPSAQLFFTLPPQEADGLCYTPSCMIGGTWQSKTLSLRILTAPHKAAAIERLRLPSARAVGGKGTPFPLPAPDKSLAAMVMEWELQALFTGKAIPSVTAIGSNHLSRCLDSAKQMLAEKGFPTASTLRTPLVVNRREGAETLLTRLLQDEPPCVETPLLPPEGVITHPDGFPQILRGRNLPRLCRIYHNQIATLWADPENLRFCATPKSKPLSILLLLRRGERQHLLPASATVVSYTAGQAILSGDGFTLTAALLPKFPLLSLCLSADGDAELILPTLPTPHKEQEGERFWYLSEEQTLFLRTWKANGTQNWLLGSFPRKRNHLYYWMREVITPVSLPEIHHSFCKEQQIACTRLVGISPDLPALPTIAAAVLEGCDPSKALLAPICTPTQAKAILLRLAAAPPSLLLPAALLIYKKVIGSNDIAACLIPTKDGRESLYLHAARILEDAMENAPENPLLPPLTAAFAKLSAELCDSTAPLYANFMPPVDADYPLAGIDPLWQCPRKTVRLLAELSTGGGVHPPAAVSALWDAIAALPLNPPAAEAALLWCGVLYGVLGFHPTENGFTTAPLSVDTPCAFRLSYKGDWIIRLAPDAPPHTVSADESKTAQKRENISPQSIFSRQNS